MAAYPVELLSLLAPPLPGTPLTLTPSISISEEYNDNVFLNNANRHQDFITAVGPALTLVANRPSYQVSAGYSFNAELYALDGRLNNAFDHQNFVGNGVYYLTPRVTVTTASAYSLNRNTSVVASNGFATGRQESWSSTVAAGLTWQMTRQDALTVGATYGAQRYQGNGVSSDTYALQGALGHLLTPRLTGTLAYGLTYLDLHGEQSSLTQTPTIGLSYRLTPTLTASISGGAAITGIAGETFVTPAGSATLVQTMRIGTVSAQYTRNVSVAGGFGGTTDTQSASGTLTLPTWRRGVILLFSSAYSTAKSVTEQQTGTVDARVFNLNVGMTYQVGRFATLFGGYTFLQQRTGGSSSQQFDVDQNRVRIGLQLGYPIRLN